MTVLDVSDTLLDGVVSPELVLVSPPEIAHVARAQLRVPMPADLQAERSNSPRTIELVAAYLFCLLVTLGPLGFIIVAQPVRPA